MNKQEAIEAALVRMRTWEEPNREVPDRYSRFVVGQLRRAMDAIESIGFEGADGREYLVEIAAAALWLLRDEVEVVEGQDLEEWLKGAKSAGVVLGAHGGISFPAGSINAHSLGILAGGQLRPVNGEVGRTLPPSSQEGRA